MLRLGIIDFDSSHSIELTQRFNHVGVSPDQFVEGARVVAGWPGSSHMAPERIPGFVSQVAACGVEIVQRPEDLLGRIDAVLVLSLCGEAHRGRVAPFLDAGIPAFVDKPFACTLADAAAIVAHSRAAQTLVFHASALRFSNDVQEWRKEADRLGPLHGAISYGPAKRAEGNPGLFHYGIHAAAVLFEMLGPGCESVIATYAEGAEVVTGRWADGRLGTLRGARRGATAYGLLAFHERGVVRRHISTKYAYRNLCRAIVESFTSGEPARALDEAVEMTRFVLAALESERRGAPVALTEVH